jgi:hypothetical protein
MRDATRTQLVLPLAHRIGTHSSERRPTENGRDVVEEDLRIGPSRRRLQVHARLEVARRELADRERTRRALHRARQTLGAQLRKRALCLIHARAIRQLSPQAARRLQHERTGAAAPWPSIVASGTLTCMVLGDTERSSLFPLSGHCAHAPLPTRSYDQQDFEMRFGLK